MTSKVAISASASLSLALSLLLVVLPLARSASATQQPVVLNTTGPNINDLTPCKGCPGYPVATFRVLNGTCTPICTGTCCVFNWAVTVQWASSPGPSLVTSKTACVKGCEVNNAGTRVSAGLAVVALAAATSLLAVLLAV